MILFFEGKDYTLSLLDKVFRSTHANIIAKSNTGDKRATVNCVGYYYTTEYSHIFILPKVFLINGKAFGAFEISDNEPLTLSDTVVEALKEYGWKCDVINDIPIYLYRAIEKYRKRELDTVAIDKDFRLKVSSSKQGKTELSLMDIILSIRDFYFEHQNLFTLIYKQVHSGYNKVNWRKTIRAYNPFINDNSVIYPYVINHKKEINYDEELLILFFNTLRYINKEYHFNINTDHPYNTLSDKDFKRKLNNGVIKKRLDTIKNNYYNETLIQLWQLMYVFAKKINTINKANIKEEYLLIRDFNNVFEDMIDSILSDSDTPLSLIKQSDGKIVDHIFKGYSLSSKKEQIYYIGDSKYYKENAVPTGEALFKQYTYAKNVIQTQINWYNSGKKHLKYRDELTEGYSITPNFFIVGNVRQDYSFNLSELRSTDTIFEKNYQFKNRIFDRDTLFLRMYEINFLSVLYAYVSRSANTRSQLRKDIKQYIRKDFLMYLNSEYEFYILRSCKDVDIKALVNRYFRELNGKIFSPYEIYEENYGLLILGLENTDQEINSELKSVLREDFDLIQFPLGEDIGLLKKLFER